jgi:alcohol dehydrogenase class IV
VFSNQLQFNSDLITRSLSEDLLKFLDKNKAKSVLLVTGKDSFKSSGAEAKIQAAGKNLNFYRWCDFEPNPNFSDLQNGIEIAKDFSPDVIIGVGGGSVLDMAKMISTLMPIPKSKLEESINRIDFDVIRSVKLALIPTTAGSGSEATHFSVLYVDSVKTSISSREQYADLVILDPDLLASNSSIQKACSGMDALSQAIESIWARSANRTSLKYARISLDLIINSFSKYVSAPDLGANSQMLLGSHFAGKAIDISKTTGPHALSYGITSRFSIPHGNAVALSLGLFIDAHNLRACENRRLCNAMQIINSGLGISETNTGKSVIGALLRENGLVENFSQLDFSEDDFIWLTQSINSERMSNNPIQYSSHELKEILKS